MSGRGLGGPFQGGPRDFAHIKPAGRRLSEYEAVICYVQPDYFTYDGPGDGTTRPDGGATWRMDSTALRCQDWYAFRDPSDMWQRPYTAQQTEQEHSIDRLVKHWADSGVLGKMSPEWAAVLGDLYVPCAFMEHGIFRVMAYAQREALSDTLATAMVFNAVDKVRHAQGIVIYHLQLADAGVQIRSDDGKSTWLTEPMFQGCRRVIERLLATDDWGELSVAANLVIEPLLTGLLYNEVLAHGASRAGDMATPVMLAEASVDRQRNQNWTRRLVELALDDPAHGEHNCSVVAGWLASWHADATAAMADLAPAAKRVGLDPDEVQRRVQAAWSDMVEPFKLELAEVRA